MESFRIGVDIGGTFTDIVFLGDKGTVLIKKVASTPQDYSNSVIQGISEGIKELNINSSIETWSIICLYLVQSFK